MRLRLLTVILLAVGLGAPVSLTPAATLTSVPMQGGMIMPIIGYDAEAGGLYVIVNPTVPRLTPLLASNPGDSFVPVDPWYNYLDPSGQGLAFSRRYGFTMDTMTDPIPVGTAIWLRKITGSPQLGFYNYRSSAPKSWTPIFGTDGTTNALQWNGMMFHPGVAAPPGSSNLYTATFEAFLADAGTGMEIADSTTGPIVLNWTDMDDGRPALDIGPRVVVTWPAAVTNWVLEAADCMSPTNWLAVTNAPTTVDGLRAVVPDSCPQKFFRVRLVP
jgi:hypothetical protein